MRELTGTPSTRSLVRLPIVECRLPARRSALPSSGLLGTGTFGEVKLAERKSDGSLCAIKIIAKEKLGNSGSDARALKQECERKSELPLLPPVRKPQ